MAYGVRMRNTSADERGTWATYVAEARRRTGLDKTAFGRLVGVDRGTVTRWENGSTRPTDGEVLGRFAEALDYDLDEVLAAAGLRRDVEPPAEPSRIEADLALILSSADLSDDAKQELVEMVMQRRARDEQQRIEDVTRMIQLARRREAG